MTITEFLLERIKADESFALSAQAEASIYDEPRWHWLVAHEGGSRWHPTLHDPARVLAECEAKRRIVERHSVIEVVRHEDHAGMDDIPFCARCGTDLDEGACPDLIDLASVYADHPDHDESWRP